jgi:hypothetical protein
MGVLTETMMRLRGEIGTWHHERVVLRHDLARQVNERRVRVSVLRATFARDRAGAHRAWFGPTQSERRTEESEARAQREQEQQRLAEEARIRALREQQLLATEKSHPQPHNPPKPVALMEQIHKTPFKGSKKH